jgi:hypothetical protein
VPSAQRKSTGAWHKRLHKFSIYLAPSFGGGETVATESEETRKRDRPTLLALAAAGLVPWRAAFPFRQVDRTPAHRATLS